MNFIQRYFYKRRKAKKIKITFRSNAVIKVNIPERHPQVAAQIFSMIEHQYAQRRGLGLGLPSFYFGS